MSSYFRPECKDTTTYCRPECKDITTELYVGGGHSDESPMWRVDVAITPSVRGNRWIRPRSRQPSKQPPPSIAQWFSSMYQAISTAPEFAPTPTRGDPDKMPPPPPPIRDNPNNLKHQTGLLKGRFHIILILLPVVGKHVYHHW